MHPARSQSTCRSVSKRSAHCKIKVHRDVDAAQSVERLCAIEQTASARGPRSGNLRAKLAGPTAAKIFKLRHHRSADPPDNKENARGERAFSRSRLGGSWVFYISTWRLWGAGKEPREFTKLCSPLSNHRGVATGHCHRLAGLEHAGRLRVTVIRTGSSGDTKTDHHDASNQRHDHNLEMGRAIGAVDRVVHGRLLTSTCSWQLVDPLRLPVQII